MIPYTEKLKNYLSQIDSNYGNDEAASPLEMLYQFYLEFCAIDSDTIRSQFAVLDNSLKSCTLAQQDTVADTLCAICTEHEKLAFLEGIRIGAQLVLELSE